MRKTPRAYKSIRTGLRSDKIRYNEIGISMQINSMIPKPGKIIAGSGKFELIASSKIIPQSAGAVDIAALLREYLRPSTGFSLPIAADDSPGTGDIVLWENGNNVENSAGFVPEGYMLQVDHGILKLTAENATGLVRAVQSVRQLFPPAVLAESVQSGVEWSFPSVTIEDEPEFCWRGMMLDVARHFFQVEEVCRLIDLFALHKFNMVHLHLTDDQGWRIEIERYPELTTVGAVREYTLKGHIGQAPREYDDIPYGGFFTQEDIRRIVAFAARRHITVVPEIDMPGHMQAAIAAYPELGNHPEFKLRPRCTWGISSHALNVRESTIEFMKNVLAEVIDLFPSRFIHIGGDEARKDEWEISREAQDLMRERGLKSEIELQSWFIRQIGAYVVSCGRRLIGWSEILEDGNSPVPGTAIMSWHNECAGIKAAASGHDVVMVPCQYTYFDSYQADPKREPLAIGGDLPCEKVYRFNPTFDRIPFEQRKYILGGQANLWTEYMRSLSQVEYMSFPRACALAEALWTADPDRSFVDFVNRLNQHRQRLRILKVNAHPLP